MVSCMGWVLRRSPLAESLHVFEFAVSALVDYVAGV